MSEVKRYGYLGIIEEEDGEVVKWEDYAALKSEHDALAMDNSARGEIIERLIGQFSAAGYHALQNSLNPAQSLLYDAMQVLNQSATDAYLNSVRADAISNALDASSNHCETDCVMDAYDCSYEIAEMRSAGAIDLHDGLVTYANKLRAGKDGE